MAHHAHPHPHAQPAPTESKLIHWARSYDLSVQVMTLGRIRGLRRHIVDLIDPQPHDVVLDAGCGTGDMALRLAKRVTPPGAVSGIDAAPEMVARARHKAQQRHAAVDFRVEALEALTFADSSFEKIVMMLVLHHLPDTLKQQALENLARVLKPSGRVFIIDFVDMNGTLTGHVAGDAATVASGISLPDGLHAAGFTDVQVTRLGYRSVGAFFGFPPINLVSAKRPI